MKYAEDYKKWPLHPKRKEGHLGGRIFWQSLNDFVWQVYTIQGYDLAYVPSDAVISKAKKQPAEVLDLKNWKLNIPVGIHSLWSEEYKQPFLNTYFDSNWFYVNAAADGVVF